MKHEQNIFALFLDLLQVRHTKNYSNKLYEEHPHKNNLYGLSQMLSTYKIENVGLKVKSDIRTLQDIEPPFLVQIQGGFAILSRISDTQVEYYQDGKKIVIPHEEFIKLFTGIVLVGEADDKSGEPHYETNRKNDLIAKGKQILLLAVWVVLLSSLGCINGFYKSWGLVTALLISLTGGYISYLLVLKQMKIQSKYADQLCSLFLHKNECNDILETKASKLFGIFSWSEIGLGYFMSNLLIIVAFPSLYSYVAILNVCALPFTLWSLWYQKWVFKQWCGLCIFVQIILWILFINNLAAGLIVWPDITWYALLVTGCLYLLPLLILNILIPRLSEALKMQEVTQKFNSLKADDDIFKSLLKSQEQYVVTRDLGILMGNPTAPNLLTVVSNPHCGPCAKLHTQIEQLINTCGEKYCIQYILTSFNKELEESARLFIAMYQQQDPAAFLAFLHEWYTSGKDNREETYKKYPFTGSDEQLVTEFEKQKEWIQKSNIHATPTLLFNGHLLPEKYKVEDLVYFYDITV
ncbi:MAG: thioredoxin domain-containing protein [Tannerellaceae bacterium]|nr:thioredoxin domain-containing protein [Tannerellaceae bacterium]